jgi:hypothetical protein
VIDSSRLVFLQLEILDGQPASFADLSRYGFEANDNCLLMITKIGFLDE